MKCSREKGGRGTGDHNDTKQMMVYERRGTTGDMRILARIGAMIHPTEDLLSAGSCARTRRSIWRGCHGVYCQCLCRLCPTERDDAVRSMADVVIEFHASQAGLP